MPGLIYFWIDQPEPGTLINNLKNGYKNQKKFATRYSAFSLTLLLLAYYAIIYFHIEIPPLAALFSSEIRQFATTFYALLGVFSLIGAGIKGGGGGGYIFYTRSAADTFSGLLKRFFIVSMIIAIFELCFLSVIIIARTIDRAALNNYLENAHLFWVSLITFGMFSIFSFRMRGFGLFKWETLQDLHSLPFVAPVFAFTAPFTFSRSLVVNNIPESLFQAHQAMFFISGAIFLLYLTIFFLTRSLFENSEDLRQEIIGLRPGPDRRRNLVLAMFWLFGIGLFLLISATLDIAFYNFIK